MNIYYVYQYLREDNTPYYIGKGSGKRAWCRDRTVPRPADSKDIQIIKTNLSEQEAYDLENQLILHYGRKNNGTGILRNLTDGGSGSSGVVGKKAWNKGKLMPANYGKTRSESLKKYKRTSEHQENLNRSLKGRTPSWTGKSHSESSRQKISQSLLGIKQPRLTCPTCGLVGGQTNMKRYHFDRCPAKF
jgi:hypothetical protein